MHTLENISPETRPARVNSIPRAQAIPLSSYDYTSVNLIVASATDSIREPENEVTHEVFFGENINRVKAIFKK